MEIRLRVEKFITESIIHKRTGHFPSNIQSFLFPIIFVLFVIFFKKISKTFKTLTNEKQCFVFTGGKATGKQNGKNKKTKLKSYSLPPGTVKYKNNNITSCTQTKLNCKQENEHFHTFQSLMWTVIEEGFFTVLLLLFL